MTTHVTPAGGAPPAAPLLTRRLLALGPRLPRRRCAARLNFRSNGPEDARVLPLDKDGAMLIFNDYVDSPSAFPPHAGHAKRGECLVLSFYLAYGRADDAAGATTCYPVGR